MGIFQQFPYSNFHEMNLDQIIKIMRQLQDEWTETSAEWSDMRDFINNYFANLDVSQEVLDALRVMLADGTLSDTIDPVIINTTESWLTSHITPTTPPVDNTLTVSGAAADAKTVGDLIKQSMIVEPLEAGTDLDTLTSVNHIYTMTLSGEYINTPVADTGRRSLEVFSPSNSSYTVQKYTNATNGKMFIRIYASSAWGSWQQLNEPTGALDDGTDLNNLYGYSYQYTLSLNSTYANEPRSASGTRRMIEVFTPAGRSYTIQRYTNLDAKEVYTRVYAESAWSDWSVLNYVTISLAANSDLDTLYNHNGVYTFTSSGSYVNAPNTSTGRRYLEVYSPMGTTYSVQRFTNISTGEVYGRVYASGAWANWLSLSSPTIASTTGIDLNDLHDRTAVYTLAINETYQNTPNDKKGRRFLEIFKPNTTTFTVQRFTNITTNEVYSRVYADNRWGAWFVVSTGDLEREIVGAYSDRIAASHGGSYTNSKYENSPLAFVTARKMGITYQDIDVVFTSDNVPVVAHSATATNAIRISDGDTSSIRIGDFTLAQLKSNYLFGDSDYSWTIQTLLEAYQFNRDLGCRLCIDIGGGSNNPSGSRETLISYMIANDIHCEYLVTSELDTFNIIIASSGADKFPLGIVIAADTTDSVTVAQNKISAIIAAKNDLDIEKAWCLVRRERMETGGDLISQVAPLLNAGINIGAYSYTASTYNVDIPSYYRAVISNAVNVNYLRYLNAINS